MTNRTTRIRSGKKPRLRLLDLAFEQGSVPQDQIDQGKRPHGGYKGSKKHPLSPYSYNRESTYLQQISGDVDQLYREQFMVDHRSPGWAVDTHKEITHSGNSPLFIHGLLSSNKHGQTGRLATETRITTIRGLSAPPKRSNTLYYRPNSTHQYLSATELRQTSESEVNIKYGRPTRTTLLRARQRSNSAPMNTYIKRREAATKNTESQHYMNTKEHKAQVQQKESNHAFLTGARYNRAHLLDSKGLSVYGVYMPRKNPLACFMTGVASTRLKERVDNGPSAPPDSPRSDIGDFPETESQQSVQRPSTAPGKRLLSAKVLPKERPKSAWGDATTTCDILQNESENLEYADQINRNQIYGDFLLIPNGLNVTGNRVVVSLRSSRQSLRGSESKLPSVTGISVPKINLRRIRDPVEETSLINQPPPTPIGSRDESEHVRKASISVTKTSSEHDQIRKDVLEDENTHENNVTIEVQTEPEMDISNSKIDLGNNESGQYNEQNEDMPVDDDVRAEGDDNDNERLNDENMESNIDGENNKTESSNKNTTEKDYIENSDSTSPGTGSKKAEKVTFFITEDDEKQTVSEENKDTSHEASDNDKGNIETDVIQEKSELPENAETIASIAQTNSDSTDKTNSETKQNEISDESEHIQTQNGTNEIIEEKESVENSQESSQNVVQNQENDGITEEPNNIENVENQKSVESVEAQEEEPSDERTTKLTIGVTISLSENITDKNDE